MFDPHSRRCAILLGRGDETRCLLQEVPRPSSGATDINQRRGFVNVSLRGRRPNVDEGEIRRGFVGSVSRAVKEYIDGRSRSAGSLAAAADVDDDSTIWVSRRQLPRLFGSDDGGQQ